MAKKEKSSRSGFVIKLSDETTQKLAAEEQNKLKNEEENATHLKFNQNPESSASDNISTSIKSVLPHNSEIKNKDTHTNEDDQLKAISGVAKDTNVSEKSESPYTDINSSTGTVNIAKDVSVENSENIIKNSNTDISNWGDYAPYITYEGDEAIYTDPSTSQKYLWSLSSNSWVAKTDTALDRVYSYEDDKHVYTETDGSKFFWDEEKKAWIPKVDDDFLAYYQMSYGFVDNKTDSKPNEEKEKKDLAKKSEAVKRKNEPQWFQPSEETNTKVYVSNLPLELTEEEFVNFMQKCGLVERDPATQKMKVKLYEDKEQNCFKGDALCTYIKIESVDLALKLLDGSDFKGNKVKVERAHFQLKGEYNPALKPKKKKKKELEKIKKMQQKLFDWRPEKFIGERSKHERIVIVKNLFSPSDFDKEVQLILDYQQDLREECSKSGEVRKVVIYDRHPEGVAQITMKEPEQADAVVQLINGRWFGKRQITAEIWDGRTKYRIAETDADISKRIDKWDKFLEGKEEGNVNKEKEIKEVENPVEKVEKTQEAK
ncbi:hypothetical protein K1T71_010986 [Dendrolimus kikuchii]|uniref:Uncharacterized protein n=1 Tax=Dendrolimus kikuchii TaxID=765133 RepID=A0ACC1CQM0_9NEOP|nr:hypothetical protein K1T71_010986 [Dendrolimus kikuchii]